LFTNTIEERRNEGQRLMPGILAAWEAEIRRITV
jgi:hypothetical protein